jgi:predicted metalloprotease with PDZ domain
MRWLYQHFPRQKKRYDLNDLIDGLKATTYIDYSDFISRYVDGKNRVPVSDHLPLSDAVWASEFRNKKQQQYRHLNDSLPAPP